MPNVMKIKYSDATIKQLAKAKAQSPHLANRFYDGKTYDEILLKLKTEDKTLPQTLKNYDRWGRITQKGQEVRKFFLKQFGLNENATVEDFFAKEVEKSAKIAVNKVKKVHNNFDGSYSQKS